MGQSTSTIDEDRPTTQFCNTQDNPPPVSHHSSILFKHFFVIFGGESEEVQNPSFHALDLNHCEKWIKWDAKFFSNIIDHCMIEYMERIFIFGGKKNGKPNNDLIEYDTKKEEFRKLEVDENVPPLFGHTAILYLGNIYIFGGRHVVDSKLQPSPNLYKYNIEKGNWTKMENCPNGEARYYHNANVFQQSMIVFGGIGEEGVPINSVMEYQFANNKWLLRECSGDQPTGRYGSISCVDDKWLFVFGGFDFAYSNELYQLNLKKFIWRLIDLRQKPPQFVFHSGVLYEHCLYIFGGKNESASGTNEVYKILLPTFFKFPRFESGRKEHLELLSINRM